MNTVCGALFVVYNAYCNMKVLRPLYYLPRSLPRGCYEQNIDKMEKPVFIPKSVSQNNKVLWVSSLVFLLVYLRYVNNFASTIVCLTFDFCLSFAFIRREPSKSECTQIVRENNLSAGYGCAVWYYYNYLKKIKPKFEERVRNFVTDQEVPLIPKLFILFPSSGVIRDYVDDNEYIHRCRELFTFSTEFSGVHKREYNLTVYQIYEPSRQNNVRCILEYAQPLKTLMHCQKHYNLSDIDMAEERKLFHDTLQELLKDEDGSYKQYELIQFNDENSQLHEILYDNVRKHYKYSCCDL